MKKWTQFCSRLSLVKTTCKSDTKSCIETRFLYLIVIFITEYLGRSLKFCKGEKFLEKLIIYQILVLGQLLKQSIFDKYDHKIQFSRFRSTKF